MESLYRYQDQLLASTDFLFRRSFLDSVEWDECLIGVISARGDYFNPTLVRLAAWFF